MKTLRCYHEKTSYLNMEFWQGSLEYLQFSAILNGDRYLSGDGITEICLKQKAEIDLINGQCNRLCQKLKKERDLLLCKYLFQTLIKLHFLYFLSYLLLCLMPLRLFLYSPIMWILPYSTYEVLSSHQLQFLLHKHLFLKDSLQPVADSTF